MKHLTFYLMLALAGMGPMRASSQDLSISPESGSLFLASEPVQFLVQSTDRFGVTNMQFFRDGLKIGEGKESPFRCDVTNMAAGNYTFVAMAKYANGLTSTSPPVTVTFTSTPPQVALAPGPTEFISEQHVRTSPAILLATVVGMNPDALSKLTLNGAPLPLQTGNFELHPPLTEGKNVFVLEATDKDGRVGTATSEVDLDTVAPTARITEPTSGATINAAWVDVHGIFQGGNLKEITIANSAVNEQIPARFSRGAFEAKCVLLAPGTNVITVEAMDVAGNSSTNTIIIMGPTDASIAQTIPVKITGADAGFAPLPVTFKVEAHVPGKIQKVIYDFNGDDMAGETKTDLQPVKHVYAASGEFFPTVTIQTTVGRFSSLSPMAGMFFGLPGDGAISFVNVQAPPVILSTIKIADPVDIKWTATSNLYVLSGATASITEFDHDGKLLRSIKNIGSNPSGFDVDEDGNVYVAATGDSHIEKFRPTTDAFESDQTFGGNAVTFTAPFDVKISIDGQTLLVSDSGNHRVSQLPLNGLSQPAVQTGMQNHFPAPRGIAHDEIGTYLFVIDATHDQITLTDGGFMEAVGTSGTNGTALGQFSGATHLSANKRALYVADTGNNRVQVFAHVQGGEMHSPVPFQPRVALASELGLNHPKSVAAVDDSLEEKVYIADTGNNRVILVKLPLDNPEAVWKHMITRLKAGDGTGALEDFSIASKDKYQQAYESMSKDDLLDTAKDLENIKPAEIESDSAQYYFERVQQGQTLTFPVEFIKEFGRWKIMEF